MSQVPGVPLKVLLKAIAFRLKKFWWTYDLERDYSIGVNASQRSIKLLDFDPNVDVYYECFINNLPFDMFEDEILPAVAGFGKVLQIRFLLSISGMSRGQAFIRFDNEAACDRCIQYFNNRPISSLFANGQKKVVLCQKSRDNDQLVFKNLPSLINRYGFHQFLKEDCGIQGALNTKVLDDCAIVTFRTHWLASQARVLLLEKKFSYFGTLLKPEWKN